MSFYQHVPFFGGGGVFVLTFRCRSFNLKQQPFKLFQAFLFFQATFGFSLS